MASADDEIMRLKAELSAVKSRAVGKIKQQAQQIAEHEATIKSLKEQLAEKESETPTSGPSSEDGDKERFVKIGRGASRTDEDELRIPTRRYSHRLNHVAPAAPRCHRLHHSPPPAKA